MTSRDADPLRPPDTDAEPFRQRRAITVLALLAGLAILLLAYIAYSAATSRPASVIPSTSSGVRETDRWQTGTPHRDTRVSAHGLGLLHPAESVSPTSGTVDPLCSPMPCGDPVAARSVDGTASWFAAPDGQAAAGPGLRQALGAGWRWARVRVCAARCVVVRLTDVCRCPNGRVIDLDRGQFARLADPAKGLVAVRVTW